MALKGYADIKFRNKLTEALKEGTNPEKNDFTFDEIAWDEQKPLLKLKGHDEVPDLTVTFTMDRKKEVLVNVIPDANPGLTKIYPADLKDIKSLADNILTGCITIMSDTGIYTFSAHYQGVDGWMKIISPNFVKFVSPQLTFEFDINSITKIDSQIPQDEADWQFGTISISTQDGEKVFIVDYQPGLARRMLEDMINTLRNKNPQI